MWDTSIYVGVPTVAGILVAIGILVMTVSPKVQLLKFGRWILVGAIALLTIIPIYAAGAVVNMDDVCGGNVWNLDVKNRNIPGPVVNVTRSTDINVSGITVDNSVQGASPANAAKQVRNR
jgi:hypothetical protein